MRLPELVLIGINIVDIIQRADVEYVPTRIFAKYIKCSESSLRTVLFRMKTGGLLAGKMGPTGGYRLSRAFCVLDLYKLLTPTRLECQKTELTWSTHVNTMAKRIDELMELCWVADAASL